ncbi:serine/threonine-protein kinase [Kitasatospora sp. MMS16-BH015]|uniref:serine/threonine-protein kinase n=1 Tax=Kitasatospora sp. MMS16-BH015 TaxID=2018025 RepID=UPI000CF244D0|nr:serine/threonine-protein kinase [Kitasatospora sp. MMS16-BH015]
MTTEGPGAQLIDGRFELLERLGGGGMGLVWRARDVVLQREVALKEVRPPDPAMLAADPAAAYELRERVLREAQALARLQHPNVVIIYHIVDNAQLPHPWLVMELVTGGSLHDRIKQGPLAPAEAARIGRGLLSALRAAHAAGILHRDVKPANVLMRTDGTPVLTDFGIAALSETTSLTATGSLIGSPEFIAPERIRGQEGNPSSDLWSLGMMLYVAVEGHHPLRRATTLATLAAILDEPLPPPTRSGPLGATLAALLSRDPAARPDAARLDRLFAAAEQGLDGTTAHGTPYSPTQATAAPHTPPSPYTPTQATPAPQAPHTPYPPRNGGPQDAVPTGYAQTPPHQPLQPPARKPARRTGPALAAAAGVAVIALLGWSLLPGLLDSGNHATAGSAGQSTTPKAAPPTAKTPGATTPTAALTTDVPEDSSPSTAAVPATGKDLLTPDGARSLVAAISAATGSSTITDMTVYPDYASADVVSKDNPHHYDSVDYRDGKVTRDRTGTVQSDAKTVDLTKIDWNQLPATLATAKTRLGVANPKSRYLIVDYGWFSDEITIRYYLTDDYGSGGYLTAGATGKVLQVVKS